MTMTLKILVGSLLRSCDAIDAELAVATNNPAAVAKAASHVAEIRLACDRALDPDDPMVAEMKKQGAEPQHAPVTAHGKR